MDASDRSLQIELSVDVLRELNHSVPDENFSAVSAQLEVQKSKQTVSGDLPVKNGSHFRNRHIYIKSELRDIKVADKEIAKIANARDVGPGDRR